MNRKSLILALLVVSLAAMTVTTALAGGKADATLIRAATAQYKRLEVAKAAGYALLPGLDHCFNNPGTGAMGFHYIQAASLDLDLNIEKPESLVYAPRSNGRLKLAAVEYIVPAEAWDKEYPGTLPVLNGHSLHLNQALGVYVLHAWVWKNNPAGMFEDWNAKVTCS